MALTLTATRYYSSATATRDQLRFEASINRTHDAIQSRINTYMALLRAGTGFFAGSSKVSRQEFHRFIERLEIPKHYPGIQGIGFSMRMDPSEIDEVTSSMRAAGVEDFHIWPAGKRTEYHSILYLEPLDARNQRALGYDMFTEPVRRRAMEQARDSGTAAASERVNLVQETGRNSQAGFLIYCPVYRGGLVPDNVEDRRKLLRGFVYSPFRADDLLAGIFGVSSQPAVDFKVFDGNQTDPGSLLHDSLSTVKRSHRAPRDLSEESSTIYVAGRPWTLVFKPGPELYSSYSQRYAPYILIIGLLLTCILYYVTFSQARARRQAEQSAMDLQKSEEALRLSEQRFRTIIEEAPISIQIFDHEGYSRRANHSWEIMWSASIQEQSGYNLLRDQYLESKGVSEQIKRAFKGERVVIPGIYFDPDEIGRTGRARWIDAHLYPLLDKSGNPDEVVVMLVDVTERTLAQAELEKRVEERTVQLAAMNTALQKEVKERERAEHEVRDLNLQLERRVEARTAELRDAIKELESFSYSVSHDLRAPLRAIDAFSRILSNDFENQLPAEAQRYLKLVQENTKQMGELVDDLLSFSRTGRQELNKSRVDTGQLVQDVLETLRMAIPERKVEILLGDLPEVEADPVLLKQVFMNLISNAYKFTRKREQSRVEIGSFCDGGERVWFVKDNGVGFNKKYAAKLFGVFQRLHRAEDYEGTGVGLAIVERIISRHGGRVWAESDEGKGASFFFTISAEAC